MKCEQMWKFSLTLLEFAQHCDNRKRERLFYALFAILLDI